MKEKDEAYKYFEQALSMTEDKYSIYICYAISKTEFKEFDKAEQIYKTAIEFAPKNQMLTFF